jgi:hypothetical protein
MWSPRGLSEDVERDWPGGGEAAVLYWRARLLLRAISGIGLATFVGGLIASFAGLKTTSMAVILTGVAIVTADVAVLHAFRLWGLFKIGGWSRRGGRPVRRAEQPIKFWIWAAASSGILVILVFGAGYLLWTLISELLPTAI